MNVNAVGHGPAHRVHPRRTAPTEQVATQQTTSEPTTDGGTAVDGAAATEETVEAPARRGGSDTPWTHALHQGNGKKTGILRRFADEIAAQQAAAGLGGDVAVEDGEPTDGTAPTDGADGTVPVDGETPVEDGTTPVDGSDVVDDTVPVDGETPADDTAPADGETVVIDGSTLAGGTEDGSVLDELAAAVEEAVADAGTIEDQPVEDALVEELLDGTSEEA